MKYRDHEVDDAGWTEWIRPNMESYRMGCCDCGLVHELQFTVSDDGQVGFRARRHERATAAKRRHRREAKL